MTDKRIEEKYSRDELFGLKPQKVYKGQYLNEISFPIGGIGAGCIGLSGTGGLRDFEIFNRPNVGSKFPKTFPLIRVKEKGKNPIARVLLGPMTRPYTPFDGGRFKANAEGFPHMDSCEFRGEYPIAWINFKSEALPIKVSLEAYNPFIPSDADASSIPIMVLKYHVENPSQDDVEVSILWSLLNLVGFTRDDCLENIVHGLYEPPGQFNNLVIDEGELKGLLFSNFNNKEDHPLFGSMALVSPDSNVSCSPYWKPGGWFSSHQHLWSFFREHGYVENFGGTGMYKTEAGSIAIKKEIGAGQSATFTFYLTWYFPNYAKLGNWWSIRQEIPLEECPTWKNYYASLYDDALDVASKFHAKSSYYHGLTSKFHNALFDSTLPPHVIDAVSSTMSILKTPTCMRLTDGSFYGWEGCHPSIGCCEGSCTHVWSYTQALPFLFPSLERSMHDLNYEYNFIFDDVGAMEFRIQLPLGSNHASIRPCADGQFGYIMHVYREWKISGDDEWLKKIWSKVKRSLEFAWEDWDEDKTGVLRNFQHNTYDIDFYGPNSMLTSIYLGALKAGAEMARFLGENDSADEYIEIFNKGRKWVDENLFNGEFYIQKYFPEKARDNQVGDGCLIDQVFGQELALIAGLGRFLDEKQVKSALRSIFKYNWKPNMREHENFARLYAVNDEAATVMCSWPKGGRPEVPFPYATEVMNGFEYQVATHCILEGLLEEGLTMVKSIRDRYDGWGRNPWNEFECGHHYARSMAAYGVLVALSGFEFDKGNGFLGFNPRIHQDDFKTFWSLDGAWGTYHQTSQECIIEVLFGNLELRSIKIGQFKGESSVKIHHAGKEIQVNANDDRIIDFLELITLNEKNPVLKIGKE
ncbi:MAG: GH116 family glycosyl-hydrolase [Candidatus Hodarchaeota archaeon]